MIPKKVFIICGEASGDLHASNLILAWKKHSNDYAFEAWGGDRLMEANVTIKKHIKDLSFMGFWEVFVNLRTILKNFSLCKKHILDFKPDAIILVDFPGFNLRMARWAKENNIKVLYYVSPQIWAWKKGRIKQIKAYVDHMFCILPFEQDFYKQFNFKVNYEGHPLLDEVDKFRHRNAPETQEKKIIALLPGSRMQEVKRKLPLMLEAALHFEEYQILVACSSQIDPKFFEMFSHERVEFIQSNTYNVLNTSSLALVTSGTATLETALFHVPQVVCYRSSPISYWIARKLVKVKYISLVNLILNRSLVTELIQGDCTVDNMVNELKLIEIGSPKRAEVLAGYTSLTELLGKEGASERVARKMIETFA